MRRGARLSAALASFYDFSHCKFYDFPVRVNFCVDAVLVCSFRAVGLFKFKLGHEGGVVFVLLCADFLFLDVKVSLYAPGHALNVSLVQLVQERYNVGF